MAKQLVNPIERHVEKAVVGVAVLVLIGVVARFLLTSPNQLDLDGEMVVPAAIDSKVAERATEILNRIRSADAEVVTVEPLLDEFVAAAGPLNAPLLPIGAPLGPEVPLIDPPATVGGHASLVQVIRPDKPAITHGRSTFVVDEADGSQRYFASNWATVAAVVDVKGQIDLQRHAYGAARGEMVIAPPQLQRRAQRPDGSWANEDWKDVDCWPSAELPPVPSIKVIEEGSQTAIPGADLEELEKFIKRMEVPELRSEMLRASMADIDNGTRWNFPQLVPYPELLRQNEFILYPDEPPAAEPEDPWGLGVRSAAAPGRPAEASGDEVEEAYNAAERLYEAAKQSRVYNEAVRAFNAAHDVWIDRQATSRQKKMAEALKRRADQLSKDILREERTGGGRPVVAENPEERKREPLPKQLAWAHDAAAGSLQDDRTYQYRMRFRILNQLAGEPGRFDDPQDASKVFVASEWSEPSDPITFEPSSLYFVISDEAGKEEVGIEFYRWFDGNWVKGRRAKFGIGDTVQKEERVMVPSILDPNDVDHALVEFSAGVTVIDIGFDRAYRERRKGTGRDGVRFGPIRSECSVVLMDSSGGLYERFVPTDKSHPEKRAASARVWKPSK